jgi:hypothetical protein
MALLPILLLLQLCAPYTLCMNEVENNCKNCTSSNLMVFVKTIWWPTADPEFSCVKKSEVSSFIGLVIDISCAPETCFDISNRLSTNIWNNRTEPCVKLPSFSSFDQFKITMDIIEVVIFLLFISAAVYKGKIVKNIQSWE